MPQLETHLVLNRYLLHLLGAEDFEELKTLLRLTDEGPDGGGQSFFFGRLATQPGLEIPLQTLAEYDRRVMDYEGRLRKGRREFQGFRYFQYLALLYVEIYLDRLTQNSAALLTELNTFTRSLRNSDPELRAFPDFTQDGLRRLAFFMATGSGKTLIMHVNLWQILHYLQHGRNPEALVTRPDGRRAFDNILLITPNEGLSVQHIQELRASGLNAGLFIDDPHTQGDLFGPRVKVIEIHKLAEEPSREGLSVVIDEIGAHNLVVVDEGHKGTSSEAQTWKNRQKKLSEAGFLLEYSATFAQAIGAASSRAQQDLLHEYGQVILFDYSYAHFYGDGYGKDFRVLNLSQAGPDQAHELLIGGLLTYYHQLWRYERHTLAYRPYNVEKPLWVLLGSSVNAMYTRDKQRRSDVAEVVAFFKRFLEEPDWVMPVISRMLAGESGFVDSESGLDLFAAYIEGLRSENPQSLYERIRQDVFHGGGGLEVWELKQAEGELGLRASGGESEQSPYFGVINIGDVSAFKRYLDDHVGIITQEDSFTLSQFEQVSHSETDIHVLIGAKKFIEGWSSWRVSSMGLLNLGKGQGSQVIQLFGRGVRLKGKGMSLRRSAALPANGHPPGIRTLETLTIFGWNADYIQTFREMLGREEVGREFTLPVTLMDPWPRDGLPVPQTKAGFSTDTLTWTLSADGPHVTLDLTPRLTALVQAGDRPALAIGQRQDSLEISFVEFPYTDVIDQQRLYMDLLEYKQFRGYGNLYIPPAALPEILARRCTLVLPLGDTHRPGRLQEAADRLLKTYVDRFVRQQERLAESQHVEPAYLLKDDGRVLREYRLRVKSGQFLTQIEALLNRGVPSYDDGEPLPRLYFDRSLFNPLLRAGGDGWKQAVSVRPPALNREESQFIGDLRRFWADHHARPPYDDREIYLLRNLPKSGIGLFHRSGFYPDFILWVRDRRTNHIRVCFLDPHGLHHDGLAGSQDRFAALEALYALGHQPEFRNRNIALDGYLLVTTPLAQIRDAAGATWDELERDYPLLSQQGDYIHRILGKLAPE